MKAAHDQRNRAAADVIPVAAVIIGYATLTHIYDSKDCSTVLHKCMLLSRKYFLLRENYTTMCFKPMNRIRTPVKQYAHTGSSEIRTPVKRNLQMEVLTDQETKNTIWRKGDTMFYKKGVTDPDYCVLRFTAQSGRYYCDLKTESFEV